VIRPGVDLAAFAPTRPTLAHPTIFCAAAVGRAAQARRPASAGRFALLRERRRTPSFPLACKRVRPAFAWWRSLRGRRRHRGAGARLSLRLGDALPSIGEAFGLVLVESLACGTPVVATDEGRDARGGGRAADIGRLFAGEDPALLAAALEEGLSLRDPAACRARGEDYPAQDTATNYLDLYGALGAGL